MTDFVLVRAAVLCKDGKIEYVYETSDIEYYIDVLGYTFIEYTDLYI